MNLDKLKNINLEALKNIDVAQIKTVILSRVDILINIFLIGITIFATIYIHTTKKVKYDAFSEELNQLKDKVLVIGMYRSQKEKFEQSKAQLLESLNSDLLISKLSEIAIVNNVQIKSFSPAQEFLGKFSTVANVKINISAKDFKSLVMFTDDVEKSEYFLRIKNWTGEMETRVTSRRQYDYEENEQLNKTIDATLEIESLKLN